MPLNWKAENVEENGLFRIKDSIERKNDHLKRKQAFKNKNGTVFKKILLNKKIVLPEIEDISSIFGPSFPVVSSQVLRETLLVSQGIPQEIPKNNPMNTLVIWSEWRINR